MSTPGPPHACAHDETAEPDAARASTPGAASSSLSRNALIGLLWALLFQCGTLALGYGVFQAARVVYRWMTGVSL